MDQDRASIEQFFASFRDTWKTNDGEALGGLFSQDGSIVNPFGQRADGRAAVGAMYSEYFDSILKGTSTTMQIDHVRTVGSDHALVDAEQVITGAGGEVVMAVRLAALLERRAGGWSFVDSRPYAVAPLPNVP